MGIKLKSDGTYEVSFAARHPITRMPRSLRRTTTDKGEKITSRAEAQRIYNQLVVEVNDKLKEATSPKWSNMVQRSIVDSKHIFLVPRVYFNSFRDLNGQF